MAMDRELHAAVRVLDSQRRAAGSKAAEGFDLRPRKAAGIDFDADLGIAIEAEIAAQDFGEAIDLASR
jgi:hypothetical protein